MLSVVKFWNNGPKKWKFYTIDYLKSVGFIIFVEDRKEKKNTNRDKLHFSKH